MSLDAAQSHHARDVLRLAVGDVVELFDDAGKLAAGEILSTHPVLTVRAGVVMAAELGGLRWTIASAVPKGPRVDWMIEKLAELGTDVFIPLAAARSVVLPEGTGKRQRWERLAAEASKQSRRRGVMKIYPLTGVAEVVAEIGADGPGFYFSTAAGARPAGAVVSELIERAVSRVTLFVGPEGGWSEKEVEAFDRAGLTGVALGATILRVETAALCAACLMAAVVAPGKV